jgi:hypothetical protein
MPWEINGKMWTPKPSAELWRLLEGLKRPGGRPHLGSMAEKVADLERRFLKKTERKQNGCIEWTAKRMWSGYGQFGCFGKVVRAHRFVWQFYNGKLSDGLCVLHRCDNPPCVNLEHLFIGTQAENLNDAIKKGHLLVVENGRKGGKTKCRATN